ncbi:MAG: DUF4011 domain-containing protein [Prevotella sp.]|nr:DUF4011 domain-containing protein [Prevotella sp.]
MKNPLTETNVRIDYKPSINYALSASGVKYINSFELYNDEAEDWRELKVSISGELLRSTECRLDLIPAGQTVSIADIAIEPDIDKLRGITESAETQFTLTICSGEEEVFNHPYPIRLMAFDQWPGIFVMPELISAFVTPNASCLAQINLDAAGILERLTGSSALNDYQTKDPNRVRKMVAAVFEALHNQGLIYITPPQSFENTGQRIRTADQVLSQKQGTCVDLSVLMASCLEGIGLHPLLFHIKGHMFVGCWLEDKYYPQQLCDDVSFISKSIADGISEMVVVEATMLTQKNATFETAVKAAEDHIHLEPDDFNMAVDVFRCRLLGVRPLPLAAGQEGELEGADNGSASGNVNDVRQFEILDESGRKITRQQIWERKLLDFSLRNNLLNIRIGKSVVPFVSFNINTLEDKLQEGTDFKILPLPLKERLHPDNDGIYHSDAFRDKLENIVLEGVKNEQVYSYLNEEELRTALKGLFRSSRTALEENGANTLYFVFGMLKWYETDVSVKPRYAPLILEPVDIIRKSGNNYVLRLREDEITFNTTLVEMMRQQYEVNISGVNPLPTDESGIDVSKVFAIVRNAIKDQTKWDVIEENLLGLFSFSKFVMWNDIHNNAEKLRESPIIESLLQNRLVGVEPATNTDVRQFDTTMSPNSFAIPVDVDSSQLEAVIESGEGRSFILYGPPGTGKSQTITNMIANALFHGRRVLFVAEKMAALEVVQKRLAKIGLDPFCIEMHSNKMNKSHLLQQLQQAIDVTRLKSPEEYESESQSLFSQRQHLIQYVNLLHKSQPSGLSLHDYISRYSSIDSDDAIMPTEQFTEGINAERIDDVVAAIEELGAVFRLTGHPCQSKLFGLYVHDTNDIENRGNTFLRRLLELMPNALAVIRELSKANNISIPESLFGCQWAERLSHALSETKLLNAQLVGAATDKERRAFWDRQIKTGQQHTKAREALIAKYKPEILGIDLIDLKRNWSEANDKWLVSKYFAKKNVEKFVNGYRRSGTNDSIDQLISELEAYQKLGAQLAQGSENPESVFGQFGQKGHEQWDRMPELLDQAAAIHQLFAESGITADYDRLSIAAPKGLNVAAVKELNNLIRTSSTFITVNPKLSLSDIIQKANVWVMNIGHLRNWSQWCLRRKKLISEHLKPVVDYIEEGHTVIEASDAMQRGLYRKLAMNVIDNNEVLRVFNGMIFEDAIEKYRNIAKQYQDLTKRALYCKLASRIPSLTIEAAENSEIGKLKRHIKNNGRGTSIRHIIEQIPTLLPKLCPCMLMSPISVAQFIDLDQEKFDIVVFDEASQMPTSEAVGAIARGKALIVVGDPKQMPPTSFFTTTNVDESEADVDDMESILDDCITLSFPEHYLRWHYRSRHESLIAFSNSQYYDGKLYTFPSVDDRSSKVTFIPIEGTYDYGKSRSNRAEAEAIVNEVVRRLNDPNLSKQSIGIVSFSKVQQDLIEDLLVDELAKHPKLERLAYDCEEPIFVKNLENVQGDERDVILFSVGYGPDKSGRVSMNFGPLNNAGGERRLNVAVSRARNEMMVFSTMQPEQIDLNRSRARGVEGLKRFLEFAKSGRMPVISSQIETQTDTSIIDAIADEIRQHGYEVDTLVGRSHFKIDLAVIDPNDPANYLLGILCDGTNYYSTPTQRDREICQPGVLKGLGWNLMRVWSTDWFLSKEQVTDHIIESIEQLIAAKNAPQETSKGNEAVGTNKISSDPPSNNDGTQKPARRSDIANIPFEVDESDIIQITNDKEKPYEEAQIPQRFPNVANPNVLALQRRNVESDILAIIQKEQPVTLGTIRKRIMWIYNQPRVSDRLAHCLSKGTEKAYVDPLSTPDNPTLWASVTDAKGYDGYRQANGRSIEDIPLVEVVNVVKMAMSQQLTAPVEELLRQIARLLGFGRRTPKTDDAVMAAVSHLERQGWLTNQGGSVAVVSS